MGFSVTESYFLDGTSGEMLQWTIAVKSTSNSILEFEDVGLPLLMNSYWADSQTHNYEEAVHRHFFVAKHDSYIYWQRPNGQGPMLVMIEWLSVGPLCARNRELFQISGAPHRSPILVPYHFLHG